MINLYDKFNKPSKLYDYDHNYDYIKALNKLWDIERGIELYEYDKYLLHRRRAHFKTNPLLASHYACWVLGKRWPAAEPYIKTESKSAIDYIIAVLNKDNPNLPIRWIAAEPVIMKNAYSAVIYARDVLKTIWPEAEPYIVRNVFWWHEYNKLFNIRGLCK